MAQEFQVQKQAQSIVLAPQLKLSEDLQSPQWIYGLRY